jgi:predicted nucleotidyltransferase component of viral defense system
MIKEWITEYNPQTEEETLAALREIVQEIVLAGLSRTDFFEKAAFYGGTALRIFYKLDRFSEDLDFSLLEPNPNFSLEPYFGSIIREFEALGLTISVHDKDKKSGTAIESAFLKSATIWKELVMEDLVKQVGIKSNKVIKIKIEIDRHPPPSFETEEKLLIRPFSFYVKCFALPSLFAGKMHAVLYRKWKSRVKGRDWYDLEWYIKKGIPLDVTHFLKRANQTGDWTKKNINPKQIQTLLQNKIDEVTIDNVKDDVVRFIKDDNVLKIWSKKYFLDLAQKLKID